MENNPTYLKPESTNRTRGPGGTLKVEAGVFRVSARARSRISALHDSRGRRGFVLASSSLTFVPSLG
ncbi:hypothetical protein PUN28_008084 [Cardiocondyla obscurior]|uniref:Uncharacterized protein n=1 Tax=Cardiocondyla obscurior TaxID=286306 RepID=A0AAW2FY64_9HYME